MMKDFLPISRADMEKRGWDALDFVYVIGDAYVDHSSFGPAIISRVLESRGYRVGIISQPDWTDDTSIAILGEPRLGFLVSAGNMDSMVNHYTVNKKRRHSDAYTPGGAAGKRPDRAAIVYGNLIRRTFKKTPIILGGIEASLRRLGHYDYWSDKMRRSILLDSGADLISYGMGEKSIVEIADALAAGIDVKDITFIKGTVFKTQDISVVPDPVMLPSWEEISSDKTAYAKSFLTQEKNTDAITGKPLVEPYPDKEFVVVNPPSAPLTTMEMDDIYELPYMNAPHPSYEKLGGVPAISEIKFSLTSTRGCFGGCSFCALTFHEGRVVQARSHESLIREAEEMTKAPDFKGYIHDVGGPTGNFRFPPGVKKVFVRSGIRFDYVMADASDDFLKELCQYHISGQLRVAPEHVSDEVLALMGKPKNAVYKAFLDRYARVNGMTGKEQYAVPYLMSSHPGSTLASAIELAEHIRDLGYTPEQVQDFYPTPSTLSTVMYYTGLDPRTMKPVYVPKSPREKAMQRALIQYKKPENYELVKAALLKEGRQDLIGFGPKCLIPPRKPRWAEKLHENNVNHGPSGKRKSAGKAESKKRIGTMAAKPMAGRKTQQNSWKTEDKKASRGGKKS